MNDLLTRSTVVGNPCPHLACISLFLRLVIASAISVWTAYSLADLMVIWFVILDFRNNFPIGRSSHIQPNQTGRKNNKKWRGLCRFLGAIWDVEK